MPGNINAVEDEEMKSKIKSAQIADLENIVREMIKNYEKLSKKE